MAQEMIYLLLLGSVDTRLLDDVAAAVRETFGIPVGILPSTPPPEYAYNKSRGQYHSRTVLKSLSFITPENAIGILAVTNVDLYVENLNYVFGEAALDGRVSAISLYRLQPEFADQPQGHRLFAERAVKEAIHELGHIFGLRHCQNPRCVMFFSNSIEDTDRKSKEFLGSCGEILRHNPSRQKAAA